jgi:hypothetical protein
LKHGFWVGGQQEHPGHWCTNGQSAGAGVASQVPSEHVAPEQRTQSWPPAPQYGPPGSCPSARTQRFGGDVELPVQQPLGQLAESQMHWLLTHRCPGEQAVVPQGGQLHGGGEPPGQRHWPAMQMVPAMVQGLQVPPSGPQAPVVGGEMQLPLAVSQQPLAQECVTSQAGQAPLTGVLPPTVQTHRPLWQVAPAGQSAQTPPTVPQIEPAIVRHV